MLLVITRNGLTSRQNGDGNSRNNAVRVIMLVEMHYTQDYRVDGEVNLWERTDFESLISSVLVVDLTKIEIMQYQEFLMRSASRSTFLRWKIVPTG
jgi:hypothetical protein